MQDILEFDYSVFRQEEGRLKTFSIPLNQPWPHDFIDPKECAAAGLFYTGIQDKVQCPFCEETFTQWERGDVPLIEHERLSPNCPFITAFSKGEPVPRTQFEISAENAKKLPEGEVGRLESIIHTAIRDKSDMTERERRVLEENPIAQVLMGKILSMMQGLAVSQSMQSDNRAEMFYTGTFAENVSSSPTSTSRKQWPCDFPGCLKICSKKSNLTAHMKRHDPNFEKKHHCNQCSFKFDKRSDLENHLGTHAQIRDKVQCTKCGVQFTLKKNLSRHFAKCRMGSPFESYSTIPSPANSHISELVELDNTQIFDLGGQDLFMNDMGS